eukprot:745832-Pyramimonas_sp.AAC.1
MCSIARSLCRYISRAEAHYADLGVFDNIGAQGLTMVPLEGDAEVGEFFGGGEEERGSCCCC